MFIVDEEFWDAVLDFMDKVINIDNKFFFVWFNFIWMYVNIWLKDMFKGVIG